MGDAIVDTKETMTIESYIEQGGVLTSPLNAPPRYRGELMRLMASFVDSELAGAAGFADVINQGPGIKERIAASRIVLEKTDHAERVLDIMGSFGADRSRYANHHPWTARLARDADLGTSRHGSDMRLSVFHYPLKGWADSVVMNVVMGTAVNVQLEELTRISYQPLGEAFRYIQPRERRHTELGIEGLRNLLSDQSNRATIEQSLAYWKPRVADSFGSMKSVRFEALQRFGIRHTRNEDLQRRWQTELDETLRTLGLNGPYSS